MKKQLFRALATALLLPGDLVALVAAWVLIGVLLALCWYVQLFRAISDYARSLMPNAREINDAGSERPPLPEATFVPSNPAHLKHPDCVPIPPEAHGRWRN